MVDIGPGAGIHGGNVVYSGDVQGLLACEKSITGQYLSGQRKIPLPRERRTGNGNMLTIHGAREHNLKNIDVSIPLGVFTCVTGVSGSGKSSLVNEILYKYLAAKLNRARTRHGDFDSMEGTEFLDKVIDIDQSPIGRTPRSNPATYTGVFTDIRELFAKTNDAKAKGYTAGRFSFNVKGGRCEACQGDGILRIEMHFLPDVYVPCEVCKGKRYNRETLAVEYKGKSIYDVLEMTVDEGVVFFENHPKIARNGNHRTLTGHMLEQFVSVQTDHAECLDIGSILTNVSYHADLRNQCFLFHALPSPKVFMTFTMFMEIGQLFMQRPQPTQPNTPSLFAG